MTPFSPAPWLCYVKGMAGAAVPRTLWNLRTLRTLAVAPGGPPGPAEPVRDLHLCSASHAGHNKWSKVRHIKGPKDSERAMVVHKFSLMIRTALKEGGPDPDLNAHLAQILEQCRAKNVPKAAIESAIKNASKRTSLQHTYEVRGPGGCLLLVEVLADNVSTCTNEIRRVLTRNGGMLSEGARNNFYTRGVVGVSGEGVSTERALELAIEVGAEDVHETEDEEERPLLQFICDTMDIRKVRASLQQSGMQVMSAGPEFVPRTFMVLEQDQLDAASALIGALNDHPEVVRVWDNIQADS